jgi:hypothetical protein
VKLIQPTLENIAEMIAIITAIGIAIAFYVKLREKVNYLEGILNNHPLLAHYNHYLRNQGIIDYYNFQLTTSKVETETD